MTPPKEILLRENDECAGRGLTIEASHLVTTFRSFTHDINHPSIVRSQKQLVIVSA